MSEHEVPIIFNVGSLAGQGHVQVFMDPQNPMQYTFINRVVCSYTDPTTGEGVVLLLFAHPTNNRSKINRLIASDSGTAPSSFDLEPTNPYVLLPNESVEVLLDTTTLGSEIDWVTVEYTQQQGSGPNKSGQTTVDQRVLTGGR